MISFKRTTINCVVKINTKVKNLLFYIAGSIRYISLFTYES